MFCKRQQKGLNKMLNDQMEQVKSMDDAMKHPLNVKFQKTFGRYERLHGLHSKSKHGKGKGCVGSGNSKICKTSLENEAFRNRQLHCKIAMCAHFAIRVSTLGLHLTHLGKQKSFLDFVWKFAFQGILPGVSSSGNRLGAFPFKDFPRSCPRRDTTTDGSRKGSIPNTSGVAAPEGTQPQTVNSKGAFQSQASGRLLFRESLHTCPFQEYCQLPSGRFPFQGLPA